MEFAPNPKFSLVKESKRKDPKVGTVEQDPDYIKFLEEKEQGNNKDEVGCQLYYRFYKTRAGSLAALLFCHTGILSVCLFSFLTSC